jgi:hypothetical protein
VINVTSHTGSGAGEPWNPPERPQEMLGSGSPGRPLSG